MVLSFFPREDKHDLLFCRSSDLLQSAKPSHSSDEQWRLGMKADFYLELTAAGLFRIHT